MKLIFLLISLVFSFIGLAITYIRRPFLWTANLFEALTNNYVIAKERFQIINNAPQATEQWFMIANINGSHEWTEDHRKATAAGFIFGYLAVRMLAKKEQHGYRYTLISLSDIVFVDNIIEPSSDKTPQ